MYDKNQGHFAALALTWLLLDAVYAVYTKLGGLIKKLVAWPSELFRQVESAVNLQLFNKPSLGGTGYLLNAVCLAHYQGVQDRLGIFGRQHVPMLLTKFHHLPPVQEATSHGARGLNL